MEQLTQMELLQTQELLGALELTMKKAMVYQNRFGDAELQGLAKDSANCHRDQIQALTDQLRRHSGRREALS